MYSTVTKYIHVLDIVTITQKKYLKHCTYLNFDISSPIKQRDEPRGMFAGCVTSWTNGHDYIGLHN